MVTRAGPRPSGRRRRWLALALAGALGGCVPDVHRIGPLAPATPSRDGALRVLVFGDFGYRTVPQAVTARAMRREAKRRPFDLAIQVGDNLYMCGPDPGRPGAETCRFGDDGSSVAPGALHPDDPIFRVNEGPLAGMVARGGGPLPVFLALGNHDVASEGRCAVPGLSREEAARRKACLAVAHRTDTWTMPGRHYVIDRGPVRFVVLDTNVVVSDYGGFTLDEEVAFAREATAGCGPARQCFVIGHHPPAVVHGYGRGRPRPPRHAHRMERLVEATFGARAFFAGHVHTLEHLTAGPLEVFVSGSTAMAAPHRFRYRWPATAQVRFATDAWGYAVLEVDEGGYRVRFSDAAGETLHCCEAGRTGPCRPVNCA
jgi:hypothetical protein